MGHRCLGLSSPAHCRQEDVIVGIDDWRCDGADGLVDPAAVLRDARVDAVLAVLGAGGRAGADDADLEEVAAAIVDDERTAAVALAGIQVLHAAGADEDLIGGLVVKVGSRMIDTSIRSKLAKLQNAMKEVG